MPKSDFILGKPLMNGAGTLGFAPDARAPVPWTAHGAVITNPISLRPRKPAIRPAVIEYPGGFLLHTGLPNPGFSSVLARYTRRWADASVPVIVHLMADRPEEAQEMTRRLEGRENVLALELGFAPLLADDIILSAIDMCHGELPLIACLPSADVLRLGAAVVQAGAAAVSIAPPRGSLPRANGAVSGRLFGPALLPSALDVVRSAAKIGLPCIGSCGVYSGSDCAAMLAAGAMGVELDAALWLPRGENESIVG